MVYINTNIPSLTSQKALTRNTKTLQTTYERLSTGRRINHASDDVAGLQIATRIQNQIRATGKAIENAQDGTNLLQLTDGALEQVVDILQRMRELVIQGASDTNGTNDRLALDNELTQLANEITRIGDTTNLNGANLLDGTIAALGSYRIQVGPNTSAAINNIDIVSVLQNVDALSLAVDNASIVITSNPLALSALTRVDAALQSINSRRAAIGSFITRLNALSDTLTLTVQNQSRSESQIRDADIAKETAKLASSQILQQASVSILAQANQSPQAVLRLFES